MRTTIPLLNDSGALTWRNVLKNRRNPDVVVFATVAPVAFLLLFAFVLGSAIIVPGANYQEYLIAGFLVQTILFAGSNTAAGIAHDLRTGMVDRFCSMPIHRLAVLIGRTTSDLFTNLVILVVMSGAGLLIGWRIRSDPRDALLAFAILLLFAYAVSWAMAAVGTMVRSPEVLSNVIFMTVMPLTFISNAFVPSSGFPDALRVLAEWNPVSAVTQAVRELFGNAGPAPAGAAAPLQHPVLASVLWIALLLAVFVPFATAAYRRAATR